MTLKAATGISIGGKVDGQCRLKLLSKSGEIVIKGKVSGGPLTRVFYFGVDCKVEGGLRDNLLFGPVTFQRKDWEAEDATVELKSDPVKLLPLASKSLHCVRVDEETAVRLELKEYKRKQLIEAFAMFDATRSGLVAFNSVKLIGRHLSLSPDPECP